MKCRDVDCGADNPEGAKYCEECGVLLRPPSATAESPTREELPETITTDGEHEATAEVVVKENPADISATEQTNPGLTEITITVDTASTIGAVKDEMEDAVICEKVLYPARNPEFAVIALIGADGIGGSGEAGEVFAQTAISAIWMGVRRSLLFSEQFMRFYETASREQCWEKLLDTMKPNGNYDPLLAQVFYANSCIRSFAAEMFDGNTFKNGGFGCTVALTVMFCDLKTGRVVIHGYNEGDADILLVANGQAETLSTPHTEEVVSDDQRNSVLSRWLGRCDTPGGTRFTREITVTQKSKVSVLICSDGLSNMLSTKQIAETVADKMATCEDLMVQALAVETPHSPTHDPGDDNIFVATANFQIKEIPQ